MQFPIVNQIINHTHNEAAGIIESMSEVQTPRELRYFALGVTLASVIIRGLVAARSVYLAEAPAADFAEATNNKTVFGIEDMRKAMFAESQVMDLFTDTVARYALLAVERGNVSAQIGAPDVQELERLMALDPEEGGDSAKRG